MGCNQDNIDVTMENISKMLENLMVIYRIGNVSKVKNEKNF